uniref:ShiA-like protein n=1 Tax=Escherichia coli TaxID=562 RepID=A0A7A6JMQ4_ECOLX
MTGKLRFEVNDNQGCFIFPETWFGSLLDEFEELIDAYGNDSNLLIVFYVQIMPDDFVMQLHRF